MDTAVPAPGKPRSLDRVRSAVRVRHYSPRTEDAYVAWIRRYILFHGKRHPTDLGAREATSFLSSLAARSSVRSCGSRTLISIAAR